MDFSLSKEQQDIVKAAHGFAAKEFPDRAREFDREEKFDLGLWKKACDLGFVGVFIDKPYGGLGYGFLEHCLINEEFWSVEPGIGSAILSTTFGAELIQMFGSARQKETILPKLAEGEAITYASLNANTNRLCNLLLKQGQKILFDEFSDNRQRCTCI